MLNLISITTIVYVKVWKTLGNHYRVVDTVSSQIASLYNTPRTTVFLATQIGGALSGFLSTVRFMLGLPKVFVHKVYTG